jgi:hypothetical protein
MTARHLLDYFENYYGVKYGGVFLKTLEAYLEGRGPEFYKAAAETLPLRFSHKWNKVPGAAEFEAHMAEILGRVPKPPRPPEPEISAEDRARGLEALGEIMAVLKGKKRGPGC